MQTVEVVMLTTSDVQLIRDAINNDLKMQKQQNITFNSLNLQRNSAI